MSTSSFIQGGVALVMSLSLIATAQGQGLLERLEKRLEGVLGDDRSESPPAVTPAPVEPGYLGLTGDDDPTGRGVKVLAVREEGPAAAAGLQTGDVIVSVGGVVVTKLDDLETRLAGKLVGSKLNFKIDRGGLIKTLPVTLGRRPLPVPVSAEAEAEGEEPAVEAASRPVPTDTLPPPRLTAPRREASPRDIAPPPRPEPAEADLPRFPTTRASLGVTILPVTDEARRRFGLTVRSGALINAITPDGAADRAGLPIGAVVVAADGRRIDRPDDLIEVVRNARPGDSILLSYYQRATLLRKSVRLGEAGGEARVVETEEPPPELERPAGERPLLRRLEKAIGGIAAGERPAGIPFAPGEAGEDLAAEVARLRDRVEELERRLTELEGKTAVEPESPE